MRERLEILKAEFFKNFKTKIGISMMLIFVVVSILSIFLKPELETEKSHLEMGRKIVDTRDPKVIANEKFNEKINSLKAMSSSKEVNYISSLHKKYKNYKEVFKDPLALEYYVNFAYESEISKIRKQSGYEYSMKFIKEKKEEIKKGEFDKMIYNSLVDQGVMVNDKLNKIKFKEYKDVAFWQVFNYKIFHPVIVLFMLIFSAIIFSTNYTNEIISGVDNLILSSKNKYKVLNSKIILTILLTIGLYFIYLLIQLIGGIIIYGPPINGEMQAFRILDNGIFLKTAITIKGYILLKIGVCTLVLLVLSILALMSSFLSSTSLASIGVFSSTLLMTKILTYFTQERYLKVTIILDSLSINRILFQIDSFIGMYLGRINIGGFYLDINSIILEILFIIFVLSICVIKIKSLKLTVKK